MSNSKPSRDPLPKRALKTYASLLQTRPIITKAATSAFTAGLGNLIAQIIVARKTKVPINWRSTLAFAGTGLLYVGPLMHYFYIWIEKVVPRGNTGGSFKRILLDRFLFAPPFLVIWYYIMSILEGAGHSGAVKKIKESIWATVKMNWKIWTVFQYFNVNYVPLQYRVVFASVISLIWNIFLAYSKT